MKFLELRLRERKSVVHNDIVVAYQRLKNNGKFQPLRPKSGRIWEVSLTGGFNYSELTGEILVFWKSGRLWEVVAQGGTTVVV